MPVKFSWSPRGEDKPVTLNSVDEAMCKDLGIECDPEHFCNLFQLCQLIGASLSDGSKVNRDKLIQRLDERFPELKPRERALLLKYLCDDYDFAAWR